MTPPTTSSPARPEVVTPGVPATRPAWIERATSADHKVVGILLIGTALTFLALAATEFALMRAQLFVPENSLIEPEIFNRLLSAAPVTFLVLFAIPLALGLISYIVPLQIGARSTAVPRLGQLGYWLYAMGALLIYASFLYAAPETGTVALPPLSDLTFSPSNGADAWIAGTALAVAGFVCLAINMLATLNRHRAPGLAWRRMPLFAWSATVINAVLLVIGPIMLAALTMLMVDRRYDGVFFDAGEGGAPLLYEHLGYIFLTGCYVIVFLFAAGAISEILPTFARKPIFSHRAAAGSFVAVAVLGLLAWMQNMYAAPLNEGWTIAAMVFALSLAVPVGLLIYDWIATLWGGALQLKAAAWYALIAISTMACGLAGELGYSVIPVGWALDNTTASQGDTLYVLVGGGVFGGFAALHYWFPKISARLLGESVGKISLVLMFIGIHVYVLPMFLAGLEGQPVDIFKYYEDTGVDTYNLIASIGAFFLVAGILLQLCNAAYSWNNGIPANGHDPWGGATLEWFATSPPPVHNFDVVPDVRSTEPLHDIRDAIRRRSDSFTKPEPLERLEPTVATAGDGSGEPDEPAPPQQDAAAEPAPATGTPEPDQGQAPAEAAEVEAQPEAPPEDAPQTPEANPETGGGEDDQGNPSVA
jgi:heme/copper-type cytochrome/quinol oxidase subunit 1